MIIVIKKRNYKVRFNQFLRLVEIKKTKS